MALNNPGEVELRQLVEASQNLNNATCELGRIQLGLRELQSAARSRASSAGTVDAKAHYLLAGSGFNAEQALADISSIANLTSDVSRSRTHQTDTKASDVGDYLYSKKQQNVFASIDGLVDSVTRDFSAFVAKKLAINTRSHKNDIYALLGLKPPMAVTQSNQQAQPSLSDQRSLASIPKSWGRTRIGKKILGDLPDAPISSTFMQQILAFAKIVSELADNPAMNFCEAFGRVFTAHDVGSAVQINETWAALGLLSKRLAAHRSTDGTLKEDVIHEQIVQASKQFLETQYLSYIDSEIARHRQDAYLGGVPSVTNKIKAFVQLSLCKDGQWPENLEILKGAPIWAYLYFLIRTGHLEDALALILERNDIFDEDNVAFTSYFKAFLQSPDNVLPETISEGIRADYVTFFRPKSQFDPYKQAVYKIIGRCDLQRRSLEVCTTIEDWLWIQLSFVRDNTSGTELRNDRFNLEDLQAVVLQTGAAAFDESGQNPGKYFEIMMLTGLFSNAVDFLHRTHEINAVHYAIGLALMQLLTPANDVFPDKDSSSWLSTNGSKTPAINFAGIIGRYTRLFRQTDPGIAADYIALIAQNKDCVTVCREALEELVLSSGRFADLIGDSTAGKLGLIEKRSQLIGFSSKAKYFETISGGAAAKADEDGRILDAVRLFYLAGEHDRVQAMANAQLGQLIDSTAIGVKVSREKFEPNTNPLSFCATSGPESLARNLVRIYKTSPGLKSRVDNSKFKTCELLLKMVDAMDLFADEHYQECITVIDSTGLLGVEPQTDVSRIRQLATQLSQYDESVARNILTLLELMLESCIGLSKALRNSGNPAAVNQIAEYRHRVNSCIVHAGLIQHRMPRQVYSRLTQLEAAMLELC